MRLVAAALSLAVVAAPAAARNQDDAMINRTPDAQDVAMTPITDLNLAKDPIPAVLLAAVAAPYASDGLVTCERIADAIAPLDATLGPDMDVAAPGSERVSAGAVAKSVVASFIPFRGVIRELSGAADHQREFQAAIYAGAVRRGFLKGLGQQMKCAYPSRPASAGIATATPAPATAAGASASADEGFVSQPVVQEIPGGARRRR